MRPPLRSHVRHCRLPRSPGQVRSRHARVDGGIDVTRDRASGPRRRGGVGRPRGRRRAWPPSPRRGRPLARGAPADGLGVGAVRDRLQRRDLQPRVDARRARRRRGGAGVARSLGHRGDARRDRALGRCRSSRAIQRHVRVRAVGPGDAHAAPRPRPSRREAALLRRGRRSVRVRIGTQGVARAARLRSPGRPRGACALSAPRLRAFAALDLRAASPSCRRPLAPRCASTGAAVSRCRTFALLGSSTPSPEGPRDPLRRRCVRGTCRTRRRLARLDRGCAWSPTCRSARSCPAASTRRWWLR